MDDSMHDGARREREAAFVRKTAPTSGRHARPDLFAVMGLPRRLDLDPKVLEPIYHRLSREVHPDFHHDKPPEEQAELLGRSALVNTAYRTLRDFHARVAYLVELEGGGALKPKAPPELLEDVIEVQDLLGACRDSRDVAERRPLLDRLHQEGERLRGQLERLESDLKHRAREWDAAPESDGARVADRPSILRALQDLLAQRIYLMNLLRDLESVPSTVV
jgi:molecular chaperone HscB